MDLIERVARAQFDSIECTALDATCLVLQDGRLFFDGDCDANALARAAIAEVLDAVESHLSAVQYDPAPYTAMKHRLAQLRKDALGE